MNPSTAEADLFAGRTKIRALSRPTGPSDEDKTIEEPDTSNRPESAGSPIDNRPNRHRPGHHKESFDKKPHGSRPGRGDPDANYSNLHHPDHKHSDRNSHNHVFNLKSDELDGTEPMSDDEYRVKPGRPGSKEPSESKRPYERLGKSDKQHGDWSPFIYDGDTVLLEPYDQTESELDGNRTGHKPRPPRRGDIGIQSLDEKSEWDQLQMN